MPKKSKPKKSRVPAVEQLPSGSWHCKLYIGLDSDGKRIYRSITGKTAEEVHRLLSAALAEKRISEVREAAPLTVGEAVDEYIESLRGTVAEDSINTYKMVRRNHLQSVMLIRVCDLTSQQLQQAVSLDRKRLSSRTVNNALSLVIRAVRTRRPDFNPLIVCKPSTRPEVAIPDDIAAAKILDAVYGTEMEIPCYLSICCGLRRSEICGLKWEDIDLDKGLLHIRRALVVSDRKLIEKDPKTPTSKRTVKLPTNVIECLRDHADDPLGNAPYIVIHPDHVSHRFNNILKRLDIPHFKFHAGRHFAVSTLYERGFPEKYVAAYMGHSTTEMVNRVYTHIKNETRTAVDEAVSEEMSAILPRKKKDAK